jgi:hypothetical protein
MFRDSLQDKVRKISAKLYDWLKLINSINENTNFRGIILYSGNDYVVLKAGDNKEIAIPYFSFNVKELELQYLD